MHQLRETDDERVIALDQCLRALCCGFEQARGVGEPRLRRRQLAPFRFGHAERRELTAACLEKLPLGRRCLRGTCGGLVLFERGAPNAPAFTDLARQCREAAECVEQRPLSVSRSERLMRVLPMQIDQSLPELGELRKGCGPAIDPRAASSLRVDHATEQHVVVGRERLVRQPGGRGGRVGNIEFGGEFGALRPGTQLPRFEPITEQQGQRVEKNRFSGARFAGQHRKPVVEFDVERFDYDEVADRVQAQHK